MKDINQAWDAVQKHPAYAKLASAYEAGWQAAFEKFALGWAGQGALRPASHAFGV